MLVLTLERPIVYSFQASLLWLELENFCQVDAHTSTGKEGKCTQSCLFVLLNEQNSEHLSA